MKLTRDISPTTWKVLRNLVRESQVTGRNLRRHSYSRRTRDGTWLDKLVAAGLIEYTGEVQETYPAKLPAQHRAYFRITSLGKEAAEFGQYEVEYTPPAPVKPTRVMRKIRKIGS